jgi:hypothetical protein
MRISKIHIREVCYTWGLASDLFELAGHTCEDLVWARQSR